MNKLVHTFAALLAVSMAGCGATAEPDDAAHGEQVDTEEEAIVSAGCQLVCPKCAPGSQTCDKSLCVVVCEQSCGGNVCGKGTFCCNASCGTCAPIGGGCTQQVCDAAY
jgi:hypothetical protein